MKRWTKFEDVVRAAQAATQRASIQMPLVGAHELLQAFFDDVRARVMAGETVNVPGFGLFRPASRKARRVKNPQSGEYMQLPAIHTMRLQPAKKAKVTRE
jgi:DNA-binding protein HU-beta